jgi:hypothetical protein
MNVSDDARISRLERAAADPHPFKSALAERALRAYGTIPWRRDSSVGVSTIQGRLIPDDRVSALLNVTGDHA